MLRSSMAFVRLEDRLLMTAEPTVSIDVPANVELGNNFQATITFDNTNASDVGFGPYVDLIVPTTGSDGAGAATDDGVTFLNATYLGAPVLATQVTFDNLGNATHPFAVDSAGNPIIVTGTPGDTLVVLTLPFGSFTPSQTPADVVVNFAMSDLADLDKDLTITALGGFRYGGDPLDNPTSDAPLRGSTMSDSLRPTVIDLEKVYIGPEDETATGPNYVRQYQLRVDIATGQTVDNVVVTDLLPPEIQLTNVQITQGSGTVTLPPGALTSPVAAPNNQLQVSLGSITGAAGDDAVVTITYFVPYRDAGSATVLTPGSGADDAVVNTSNVTGAFVPTDVRDPTVTVFDDGTTADPTTEQHTLEASPLVIQKSSSIASDANVSGLTPGDVIEYTLQVQLSDFYTVGDIVIDDLLSDGQRFDTSFAPVLIVTERGATSNGAFNAANFNVTLNADNNPATPATPGTTDIRFRLSNELVTRGLDGILVGGDALSPGGPADFGGTTATITYRAIVQDNYTDTFIGRPDIGQGDIISNTVRIDASVRDNASPSTITGTTTDDSGVTLEIVRGEIAKSIYAVNGATVGPTPIQEIQAGDTITFRLTYTLPLSKFEDFEIRDFLPLPVFSSAEVMTFNASIAGSPPPAGVATFGSADTFFALSGIIPVIAQDTVSNQVNFVYGDFAAATPQTSTIDVLFTVTVVDADFADGLFLTNQATGVEANTSTNAVQSNAIVNFIYEQPELEITKGVVSASEGGLPAGAFSPGVPGGPSTPGPSGVTFSSPGTGGAAFSGTITSDGLDVTPINANLTGLDAGDLIKFAIVVENTGGANDGAFDVRIRDTLPAGFAIPAGGAGLNLSVTDGTGTALAFTSIGGGLFDPAGGIELTDTATTGALAGYSGTSGRNLVIITYDLVAEQAVTPNTSLVNTATLTNYSAFNGGIDRTPVDLTDTATVSFVPPEVDKEIISTSHTGAGATAGNSVTIGEEITYRITVTLPEGTLQNAVLTDLAPLNTGTLQILSVRIVSIGNSLTGGSGGALAAPGVVLADNRLSDGLNDDASFNFGTIVNVADNVSDDDDEIIVEVTARVVNASNNTAGDVLTNRAQFTWQGGSVVDNVNVTVVEPNLVIDKQAPAGPFDAGDTVPYTIVLTNTGANVSTAYDIVIADLLADLDLDLVPGTVSIVASNTTYGTRTVTTGNGATDTTVGVAISELRVGDTITIRFDGRILAGVSPSSTVDNTATADFSSLPPTHPGGDTNERDYTRQDSAQVPISAPTIDKVLVSTDHTGTGATTDPTATIGELVTYDITVTIPEGTTANAVLSDLALGTNPGTLQIVSAQVTAIGANLTNTGMLSVGSTATPSDGADADTVADNASFNFGTITNTADGTVDADDRITIRVTARVFDEPGTARGDVLVNRGSFSFTNGAGGTSTITDDVAVTVVEPTLLIDKSVPGTRVDGSDAITYTITINHAAASNATAYDIVVEDLLADLNLDLIPGTVTVSNPGYGTQVVTAGNTTSAPADTTVNVTISELRVGNTITIQFQGRASATVPVNSTLNNTADLDYTSLPEATLPGSAAVDRDYTATDSASVQTRLPTLTKTVVATSIAETGNALDTPAPDLLIGELVTYHLVIEVPEGTSPLTLVDQLPTSRSNPNGVLSFVSARVVSIGANISANALTPTITAIDTGTDNDTLNDRVTFAFGTVTNTPDGARTAADLITVEVVARAEDSNQNSNFDTLINVGTLTYGSGPTAGTLTASATIDIVEPVLDIQKTVSNPPPGTVDAGDIVTYTLVVNHTAGSTATAFDLVITDILNDAALDLVAGSVTTSSGTVTTGNGATDTAIRIDVDKLDRGVGPITITYQGRITDAAVFGSTATNVANLEWDSNPDEGNLVVERTGRDSDDAVVAFPRPTFDKSIFSTSVSQTGTAEHTALDDLVIGEEVTFDLVITMPEGTSTISLVDNLPSLANGTLGYVSSSVVTLGGATSSLLTVGASGIATDSNADAILDRVSFNFGTVTNAGNNNATDNQIVVRVVARVLDIPANADADILVNSATLTYSDGTATSQTLTDTASVEIVEPVLVISKTANTEGANPGDLVTYTLVVNHTATSTANAFDVVISDALADPNLQFVPGTVTVNGVAATPAVSSLPGDGFQLRLAEITQAETVTITYQARLLSAAPRAAEFDNTANLTWDSRPGDGDPATPDDNGRPGSATASDRIFTPPILDKTVFSTNNPSTGTGQFDATLTDLSVGETVTYRITVTLPETLNRNLVITDVAPAGLELLTASVVSSGTGLSFTAPTIVVTAGQATWNFGNVTNPFDGTTGADDVIVLEVTGRVLDVPGNVDGTILTNTANLAVRIGAGTPGNPGDEARDFTTSDTVDVEIVEPLLTIDKSRDIARGDAGTEVTYTLVIRHDTAAPGVSHASAHDVVIEDLISDPDLQLVAGSVTTTSGTITALGGDGFRVNVAEIPLGGTVTITYRALILNSAVIGDTLDNTATLAWDSNPGPGGRVGNAQDSESVIVDRAPIEFTKSVFATSLDRTGSRIFDPSLQEIEIGETVTYRLTATLAEGTDTITIVDRLPNTNGVLDFVSARVVTVGGNITLGGPTSITNTGNVITFDFGSLVNAFDNVVTDADRITVEIVARAPNSPLNGNGDRLTNTATLTSVDGSISASADIELLVPQSRDRDSVRAVSGYVDDARFTPLVSLNPFFSGTAEYGSWVTVTLRDSGGSVIGTRGGFADAGGNWVANFPLSTIEIENELEYERDLYFVTSRLFSDSHGLIGRTSESLAQAHWANREIYVGTRLLDQPYTVEVHQELPTYNSGLDGAFNARAYFTPVITNEVFGQERLTDIQKVFEDRAEFSLDQLYSAALAPLGFGGNRFTDEFLAIAGSPAGR